MRLIKAIFLSLGLLLVAALLCAGAIYVISGGDVRHFILGIELDQHKEALNQGLSDDATYLKFIVPAGTSSGEVAQNLVQMGLIKDQDLFLKYARYQGIDTRIEAGTYFFNKTQSIVDIAERLTDANSSKLSFRIIEGMRLEEIAEAIDDSNLPFSGQDFLDVSVSATDLNPNFIRTVGLPEGASLEGFMFPDIYDFPPDVDPIRFRDTILTGFMNQLAGKMIEDASAQGFTIYEIVNLASIIEREALYDDEHPMISSVYRNRLKIDMLLNADPTLQYALHGTRDHRWWPVLTLADYQNIQSPYNTYLVKGLPPSPIASPGLSAIMAAIYPAESPYYFFQAECDGSGYHEFAETYEEHLENSCP